jgi:nicotinamide-nucleotide amidase
MPGVPREMKSMFQKSVRPLLMKKIDACIYSRSVKVFGVGESLTETMLLPFIDGQTDPTIATYAKEGIVEIRITSKRKTEEEASAAVEDMLKGVMDILGDSVFTSEGREIYEEAAEKLIKNNITISCCESPTAGMFASWLAKVPAISEVFGSGYVIYDERSAVKYMDVPEEFIKEHTLYSSKTADIMAENLYKKTGSRMCLAITGNAGPDTVSGFTAGMYTVSVMFDGKLYSRSINHKGRTRDMNIEFMTQSAFDTILRIIDNKKMDDVR